MLICVSLPDPFISHDKVKYFYVLSQNILGAATCKCNCASLKKYSCCLMLKYKASLISIMEHCVLFHKVQSFQNKLGFVVLIIVEGHGHSYDCGVWYHLVVVSILLLMKSLVSLFLWKFGFHVSQVCTCVHASPIVSVYCTWWSYMKSLMQHLSQHWLLVQISMNP